ncbi:hypothetical protein [Pantoea septica]|uniref:hypothetical protein n=1 Tax=Pantoea septica TaxID=472695 RepID=UPI0023EF81A7|nr:hypothetical protein [Pantoea septica]
MALGGQLDGSGLATGRADTLNNHSATIESAGDMQIDAGQINNVNDHFSTELATVSTEAITEYQQSGDTVRWKAGEEGVFVDRNSADSLLNLNTPGKTGSNHDRFTQYDYTRTVQETQIAESDPAKIVAGGNMTVNADKVFNDKSQIVAGNTLTMNASEVENVEVAGQRITTDDGKVTSYYRIRHKGGDSQGKKQSAYTPPEVIETIALKPSQLVDHGAISGTPVSLAPQSAQGTDAAIGHTGDVSAAVAGSALAPDWQAVDSGALPAIAIAALKPGQRFEVASSVAPQQGEAARVVRIVGPDTRLPDNSLFKTNPSPGGKYLVETDPRFTQEKQWLSSDYMQERLTQNSDNVLKRLGDGYYEQRLIRDVEHANQTLSPIFDKEKEQNRLQEAQLIEEIGNQAADIARTEGQIAATKAANERMKAVTPGQLKAAEAEWRKANPGKEPTASDISGQAYQTFYNQTFSESGFGTGGKLQQAIQAATAAVQGLAGGNLTQAITGGSAPYLAEIIHNQTLNPDGSVNVQANLMAHAVVGAVTAYAAGNSALAGAAGAAMDEYIAQQMYPGVKREDLTEEQRQTISALGTLAAWTETVRRARWPGRRRGGMRLRITILRPSK